MASELKVNTITEATSGSGITFAKDIIPATPLSHRNIIDNGAMQVAQRGTSGTGANAVIAIDRYKRVADNNGAVTTSQVTDAPTGFKNSYKATITSADTSIAAAQYEFVEHTIEGQNTIPLALGTSDAKQITLSFYVKSSEVGIFGGVIKNGPQNRSYPYQYTINSANTWERKTITLTGDTSGTWPTDNTAGLKVQWSLGTGTDYHATANAWGAGNKVTPNVARSGATSGASGALLANAGATWQITGVQLELGTVATPFEHRSYADEIRRCQRYFYVVANSDTEDTYIGACWFYNTTYMLMGVRHPVPMRTSPTVESTDIANSMYVYISNGNHTFNDFYTNTHSKFYTVIRNNTDMSHVAATAGGVYHRSGYDVKIYLKAEL